MRLIPLHCELIDDYLDEQLTANERAAFEEHLSACDACREALSFHQATAHQLRQYASQLTPTDTIQLRGSRQIEKPNQTNFPALAVAASLVFLLAGFAAYRHFRQGPFRQTAPAPVAGQGDRQFELDHQLAGDHPSGTGRNTTAVEPNRSTLKAEVSQPVIRELKVSNHVAVVEQSKSDDLTIVMLYPTISVD